MWVKCPDCGLVSQDSTWLEADVYGCETCGSHSGHRCPNPDCYYSFDSVFDSFEKLKQPDSLLELIAIAVDEAEKADEKRAEEQARLEAQRRYEEQRARELGYQSYKIIYQWPPKTP